MFKHVTFCKKFSSAKYWWILVIQNTLFLFRWVINQPYMFCTLVGYNNKIIHLLHTVNSKGNAKHWPVRPMPALQWITIGWGFGSEADASRLCFATCCACFSRTWNMKERNSLAEEGTPWSGQLKKSRCVTLRCSFVWKRFCNKIYSKSAAAFNKTSLH